MKCVLLLSSVVVGAALVGACGGPQQPIIDMQGKDPVKVERDRAECAVVASQVFAWGNAITKCMASKGYVILVGY